VWRTRKSGTKWSNCGTLVKMAQNGQDVAHSYKWQKIVKLWRTRKNGTKWSNCGALVKMAQNGQNVAHS